MYLPVEHVQAEIDIANLKLAAVLKRYPDRQLHGINRSARQGTIQRWIEWEQHSCFGQMTIIQSDSFFTKVMLSTAQRLASLEDQYTPQRRGSPGLPTPATAAIGG